MRFVGVRSLMNHAALMRHKTREMSEPRQALEHKRSSPLSRESWTRTLSPTEVKGSPPGPNPFAPRHSAPEWPPLHMQQQASLASLHGRHQHRRQALLRHGPAQVAGTRIRDSPWRAATDPRPRPRHSDEARSLGLRPAMRGLHRPSPAICPVA